MIMMNMKAIIMIIVIMKMAIVHDNNKDHCMPEDPPGSVCNDLSISRGVDLDLI